MLKVVNNNRLCNLGPCPGPNSLYLAHHSVIGWGYQPVLVQGVLEDGHVKDIHVQTF